jgi:hypothetical protein
MNPPALTFSRPTPMCERLTITPKGKEERTAPGRENAFAADCGRRVCAWCVPPRDMGPAPLLAAGRVTHGICEACAASMKPAAEQVAAVVRPHPAGGWTHARAISGAARVYCGNWPTRRAAVAAL